MYVLRDFVFKTPRPNLYDYLKVFAILAMIVDHIGFFVFPHLPLLRLIGRLAFPVFLFLVWFNWSYKFDRRLWLFWLIVQIPFTFVYLAWYVTDYVLNILLCIWLVRLFLSFFHRISVSLSSWVRMFFFFFSLLFFFLLFPYTYTILDYGSMVFVFGMLGYFFRFYYVSSYLNFFLLLFMGIFVFCFHYFTQFFVFWFFFSELQWFVLSLFYIFELQLFVVLSEKNYSLCVSKWIDWVISRSSRYALGIYVFHIVLLSCLWFFVQ